MSLQGNLESRKLIKESPGAEKDSTRVITIIFFALLIDLLGFTLILPLLPSILDHYSKNDDGVFRTMQHGVDRFAEAIGMPPERKYNSVLFGGLIGSVYSVLQFLASPLTGAASDYFGRKPVMLLTVIGLILSYTLWAISRSFGIFLFSRIIGGISKGNVSLSTAIIADLHCPKARSKGMAMIGVAFSLGFTLGPMLGAYLALESGKRDVFYLQPASFAVMFAVTDLIFIILFLPETLPKEKRVSSVISGFQPAVGLVSPWSLFQFSAVSQGMDSPSKKSKFSSFSVNFYSLLLQEHLFCREVSPFATFLASSDRSRPGKKLAFSFSVMSAGSFLKVFGSRPNEHINLSYALLQPRTRRGPLEMCFACIAHLFRLQHLCSKDPSQEKSWEKTTYRNHSVQ